MIKITPRINSAIGATLDRLYVRKCARGNYKNMDQRFYDCLVKESGPSTNNLKKIASGWKKAYFANLKRNMMIYNLRNQFRKK